MSLHERALCLAKGFLRHERELLSVLIQMQKGNAFLPLRYSGVYDYAFNALKLSEAQSYYYQKVVAKSCEVPKLEQAVVKGELSLSQARRITSVLNNDNCVEWIGKAKELKQKELEKAVAEVNPAAKVREGTKPVGPKLVQLTIALTPEVEALLNQVRDLESQRTKKHASWNDVMKAMAESYLEKHCPIRKAKRATLRKVKPTQEAPQPGRRPNASKR